MLEQKELNRDDGSYQPDNWIYGSPVIQNIL